MERKKLLISLIAGSCALITIGSAALVAMQLIGNNKSSSSSEETKEKKPLSRGNNYEHYELTRKFLNNVYLSQVVDKTLDNGQWVKAINEDKFKNFMKTNFHTILKSIPKFATNADNYEVDINYQLIKNNTEVMFDVVWSLPKSNYHYYDQLCISF